MSNTLSYSQRKNPSLFDKLWLCSVLLMLFYSFFFQYGISVIGGAMVSLCAINILFALVCLIVNQHNKNKYFSSIIVFVLLSVFISQSFTSHGMYGLDIGLRMIEYVFASLSVYLLIKRNPQYLFVIMWVFTISISLLALVVITKGTAVTAAGGMGLEDLNVNVISSFFIIMTFCSFMLLGKVQKTTSKIFLISCMVLVSFAQVGTASRRGFIVLTAMVLCNIIFAIIPYHYKDKSFKKLFSYILILIILAISALALFSYVMNSTLLGERLQGEFNSGDDLRAYYQAYAMTKFIEHPLFGIGIGGISHYIGHYSHSFYYELFSCTGLFMAGILLISILAIFKGMFGIYRRYKKCRYHNTLSYYACVSLIYLMSLLVSGVAVVMIYDYYFYISFAILSALLENMQVHINKFEKGYSNVGIYY